MIDVSHLKKNYRSDAGELIVLDDVTFRVEKGEFFCIVGSSGSGKSTLLRCLATIDKDCEGKILIDGVGHKEYVSRKSIAFVSQDYSNFPWLTVKQNIQLGNPERRSDFIFDDFNPVARTDNFLAVLNVADFPAIETDRSVKF